MLRIKIIYIGKTKESWLQDALAEYEKRVSSDITLEWLLVKNDKELEAVLGKEPTYTTLDPTGASYTSEAFSTFLHSKTPHTFVIGGPEGIPHHLKRNSLSFSTMTFTHQMIRLLLLEQIYRAVQIHKNSPYHK